MAAPYCQAVAAAPPEEFNLKQVAGVLGVHYMTAYRYVRTGRLPARLVGTGWVVDADDLAAFSAPPEAPPGPGRADAESRRSTLRATLARGDETAAWRVLEQALAAGSTPADCYLGLLIGAIDDISGRSSCPDHAAADEYLAAATAARLVARLGARFRRPGRSRGTVVFGAPLGEHHTLPIAVVADLVRLEGYTCLELGADVPAAAFAGAAARSSRLIAVGLGITTIASLQAARQTVEVVHELDAAVPVVIGGQAAGPDAQQFTGADAWAADGLEAVEVISKLASARRLLWPVEAIGPAARTNQAAG